MGMMRRMVDLPYLEEARAGLEKHFGLRDFRPGQAEVISAVMSGRNAVACMPTGAGKSLCYQLPAMLLPRLTLVVSPLIALMQDQVDGLVERGIAATLINSTLTDAERSERLDGIRAGAYRILYVAPERFRSTSFLELLEAVGVDLLAVDEAHCISQWGHDFRPDYALLGQVRKRLRPPRTAAFTATATPEVREDIVRSLLMKDPQVFIAGFDRPNLFLEVCAVTGDEERKDVIGQLVQKNGGSGIVYCSTRKAAEGIHASLKKKTRSVLYHAGMDDEARRKAQDDFMGHSESVAVATNAFGMGIDKPDIRFVAHAHIPRAVEAYYQEIGRGGRDGEPAHAVLLFNHSDVFTQERLIQSNHPSESTFADVWDTLQRHEVFDRGVSALAGMVSASEFEVSAALRIFEREGFLERDNRSDGTHSITLLEKAQGAQPHSADAKQLLASLQASMASGNRLSADLPTLSRRSRLTSEAVRHALGLLERAEVISVRRPFAGKSIRPLKQIPFRELDLKLGRVREQEKRSLLLLKRMTEYAYHRRCRRRFLLRYFGEEEASEQCGHCDVCSGARLTGQRSASASGSKVGAKTKSSAPLSVVEPLPHNALAAAELRRWRKELAKDLQVPPFIIFNDKTLLALAAALPTDRESFLAVKGAGPSHWEKFGSKVVEVSRLARASGA
jgi:ATP-dependent DNA helicase RecQ